MLAIDWVQSNTKPANIQVANIPTRFFLPSSQKKLLNTSGYYPKIENTFFSLTNNKQLKLIKAGKCFYFQQPKYKIANYLKNITKRILVVEIIGTAIDNSKILGKK